MKELTGSEGMNEGRRLRALENIYAVVVWGAPRPALATGLCRSWSARSLAEPAGDASINTYDRKDTAPRREAVEAARLAPSSVRRLRLAPL